MKFSYLCSLFFSLVSIPSIWSSPSLLETKQEHCNILSLSGGGSFGAVEVGILSDLIEKKKIPETYHIISGISVGGLNAAFLSSKGTLSNALKDIVPLYKKLRTSDIYKQSYNIFRKWGWYDTSPLEEFLRTVLNSTIKIPKIDRTNEPIVIIGSTNLDKERLDIHNFYYTDSLDKKVDILMATSAIPILFPPRKINQEYHIDGGVLTNEMIIEAISYKKCKSYDIYVIKANNKKLIDKEISSFTSYIRTLFSVFMNIFDDELSRINMMCMFSSKRIHIYYPNSTELQQYSILDFNHGEKLYEIGKTSYYEKKKYIC